MATLLKQRCEDESDAERRDRLAVNGSKRRKGRALKGNDSDAGGFSITDRVLHRLGDLSEQWARALMKVAREEGRSIAYIHALDLIGWAIERKPMLLVTLYCSRPSALICGNILENSEPLARYVPSLEDIAEYYDDEVLAKKVALALGPDETRRRWFQKTLPKASHFARLAADAPQHYAVPVTDGNIRK